jgi:hypothetical protein
VTEAGDSTAAQEIIGLGAEIAGSVSGAAAGLLAAGAGGALAGAAGGPLITRLLGWAGREVRSRLISQREEIRAGGALAFATVEIRRRLDQGATLRDDGFFEEEISPGRTAAQEILEGVLLTAERSPEEKKVPYLGRLYSGVAFDSEIDPAGANFLVKVGDELSWIQFEVLHVIAQNFEGALQLRESMFPPGEQPANLVGLAHQMFDLARRGFLLQKRPDQQNSELILDAPQIAPRHLKIQGFGFHFWRLAGLCDIPVKEWVTIANMLGSPLVSS